jgi:flavin-dependent dehydrogenase
MTPATDQLDVLVLGEHPCAALAAAILKSKGKLTVLHATIPGDQPPDRLVLVNPELFKLHDLLKPLQRKLSLWPMYGIRFLGDATDTASEHRSKTSEAGVAHYSHVRDAMKEVADKQGVESIAPSALDVHEVNEKGIELSIDGRRLRPRMLIVAGQLAADQRRTLAMPVSWEKELIHRYTFCRWRPPTAASVLPEWPAKPTMPMSLNLAGTYGWAWLYLHEGEAQLSCSIAVAPAASNDDQAGPTPSGKQLLTDWAATLKRHKVLADDAEVPLDEARSMDLPLGGALAHEGVASRTLLIGPAGGFYSACAEDIYPNCWSAIYAAEVARKSLPEPHLQDALNAFRHRWRTTLGDYLRGPQQNLRFLLALLYKNRVMTDRVAEAILSGKSVVR